jgi:hypothetical protein
VQSLTKSTVPASSFLTYAFGNPHRLKTITSRHSETQMKRFAITAKSLTCPHASD